MMAGPAPSPSHSLRRRLLLLLLAAIALFGLLQGLGAYRGALQQADAMFDDHLQQMARSLRSGLLVPLGEDDDIDLQIQIWGADGVQLFRSPRSRLPQSGVLGFSDVTVHGTRYRVYTVQTPLQTVQIAQDVSARDARARGLGLRAALPTVLLAPLLMLVVWWVVSRSLQPVERMRRQVAARAADDLSPLPDAGLPDEVRPLVQELNGLFGRVQAAFEAQKHFVADAAHELRSPLTALKLQAQALRRRDGEAGTSEASEVADPAVTRLNQGIDRAIRLVEQLLLLAREQAPAPAPAAPPPVDLQDVLRGALADALPQAQAAGIDLGVAADSVQSPLAVRGDAAALRALLRNLLDNAVKYTPAPGQVDVALREEDGKDGAHVLLQVDDSGPGIAEADRARVFDRFYRAPPAPGTADPHPATGSGLGLAIVQAIAERHQATVVLGRAPGLGGLRVTVRLPRADTQAAAAI